MSRHSRRGRTNPHRGTFPAVAKQELAMRGRHPPLERKAIEQRYQSKNAPEKNTTETKVVHCNFLTLFLDYAPLVK